MIVDNTLRPFVSRDVSITVDGREARVPGVPCGPPPGGRGVSEGVRNMLTNIN